MNHIKQCHFISVECLAQVKWFKNEQNNGRLWLYPLLRFNKLWMSPTLGKKPKKEKTRKILEDNLKNMIDGANIVVTSKCTEIWALFDEMQDELQMTMVGQRY